MKYHRQSWFVVVAIAAVLWISVGEIAACTSFHLKADDGAIVYGRTAEFGGDELSFGNILFAEPGTISGTAPENKPGLKWKAKYAAIGPTREKYLTLVDGLNEKGLVVGRRTIRDMTDSEGRTG